MRNYAQRRFNALPREIIFTIIDLLLNTTTSKLKSEFKYCSAVINLRATSHLIRDHVDFVLPEYFRRIECATHQLVDFSSPDARRCANRDRVSHICDMLDVRLGISMITVLGGLRRLQ